ncbi:hypothetical protein PTSG_07413 [Salpingoeca rosetta]|uniref:FYVE-type domain-containing protein n=1 Tax=Salpingoeca rosetta (strain ATCC 50818 / BSB-021) TaxID=946362 RepID=F2UIM4_SALR5|nr:uncharacterized protein PTSG_07413 [Salpingoeca rosetta]EGD77073.1 hypothetical protein PTSG_07413 [Salpingoeca rosetta]|eukprot:XP_004990913.1 hypothetical protein PTSG_07413 [Salpingoeca rosetta]
MSGTEQVARPQFVSNLSGHHRGAVADAIFVPEAGAVITASADKQVLVWLKRDDSTYWPSLHRLMPAPVTHLCFHEPSRTLFVGLENGAISEYEVSADYNILTATKGYPAHSGAVTGIAYDAQRQQLVSCGRDKTVTVSTTAGNGKRLACVSLPSSCMCLQYDEKSQTTFIGDFSGDLYVYRLENSKLQMVAGPLKGHTGSVRALSWAAQKKWLFSGSFDQTVILWDIGGQKGERIELRCHTSRISTLVHLPEEQTLLSLGTDGLLVIWDLKTQRTPCPDWEESDTCQLCELPFFWNVKKMWENRSVSVRRQHHCRICGKAVCDECSLTRCTYPIMGFETPTRVCNACKEDVMKADRTPLAKRFPSIAAAARARVETKTNTLVISCDDGSVKLMDLTPVLHPDARGLASSDSPSSHHHHHRQQHASLDEVAQQQRAPPTGAALTSVVDLTKRPDSDDDDDDGTDFFSRMDEAEDDDQFTKAA